MGQLESKSLSDNSEHNNFQLLHQRQQRRGSNAGQLATSPPTSSTTLGGNLFSSRSDDIFDELEDADSKSSQSFQNSTQFLSLLGHNILDQAKKVNDVQVQVQSIPIYGNNKKDSVDISKAPKLVLVGTGSSGKTSLSKLLKIHSTDYSITNFDVKNWKKILVKNIFQAFRVLFDVKNNLFPNVPFLKAESDDFKMKFSQIPSDSIDNILGDTSFLNDQVCEKLVDFWMDEPIIQICYFFASIAHNYIEGYGDYSRSKTERTVYIRHLNLENLPHLIAQLEDVLSYEIEGDDVKSRQFSSAIKDESHTVTELIVSTYVKTTGIIEIPVKYGDNQLVGLYDTGGQRNERKKWKNIMTDNSQTLSGVLFLVPLSEYNQICYEDDSINRTMESLNLFSELVNRNAFGSIPFFLIFTKKLVMEEKLKLYDLSIVPFKTELPQDLKVELVLNEENKKDLLVNILKLKNNDMDNLTLREVKLIDRFSSDPRYSPSQLLKIIGGDKTIQNPNFNHSEFVNKNIAFFKEQFFNAIQDPERREQVIHDHQVIDVKDFEHTIQSMHSIFKTISNH